MEENNLTTYEKAVLRDKEARQRLRDEKTLGRKLRFSYNPKLTPLFYPGNKALIVDIHGGGFCFKSVLDNDVYCDYISKRFDVAVLNADFTLSYEAPYPQQIVDISAELVSLLEKENTLVGLPLYFVGHSSGATLAAACAIRLHRDMTNGSTKSSKSPNPIPIMDLQTMPSILPFLVSGSKIRF